MQRSLRGEGTSGSNAERWRVRAFGSGALFSYGFRPFFLGAAMWAVLSVALWIGWLAGFWHLAPGYGALAWHAHEMLFGYGSAVVAGFLLTAVPNWTGGLPVAGWRLALLFVFWCLGRIALLTTAATGPLPAIVIDSLFLPVLLLVIAREIVAGQNWRNLKPLVLVSLLAAADVVFHAEVVSYGASRIGSRLGVAALIGLIMLIGGRIIPSFTHNWLTKAKSGHLPVPFGRFDMLVLALSAVALIAWVGWPAASMTGQLFIIAAIAQAIRLQRWEGVHTWREPLVLVLHLGYVFIPLGFLLGGISILLPHTLAGTAALHAWTVGAIGTMTIAVMTRATRGHTGHGLEASKLTVAIYGAILTAAILRVGAGLFPDAYLVLLEAAAIAWMMAFGLFLVEYGPMLLGPRQGR
jgi:uncharacterized protein involved in response to NO